MPFPAGLATIEVTGQNLLALDGSPLAGAVIFSVGALVAAPAASLVLDGSAVATITDGVMTPLTLPATDSVEPGFSYTVTWRLQTPDGTDYAPLPVTGVALPSSLGSSVDLSELPIAGVYPALAGSYVVTVNGESGAVVVSAASLGAATAAALSQEAARAEAAETALQAAVGGVSDKFYPQAFTSAAQVTVTHGLGKYPSVTVIDSAGDEVEGDVLYLSASALVVSFSAPFSGTVYCN